MNEKYLKLILDQLGKQAFPDDTDPWTSIQNRLAQERAAVNPSHTTIHHPQRQPRRLRLVAGIVMALLAVAIIFLLTPSGRTLAKNLSHLFRPISVEQLPTLSNEALAPPTFAPTFAATLASIQENEPVNTPSPVPHGFLAIRLKCLQR